VRINFTRNYSERNAKTFFQQRHLEGDKHNATRQSIGQQKIGANYTPVSIFLTVFAEAPW